MGFTPSCPSCHHSLPGFSPSARHSNYAFPKRSTNDFAPTQNRFAANFRLPPVVTPLKWLRPARTFRSLSKNGGYLQDSNLRKHDFWSHPITISFISKYPLLLVDHTRNARVLKHCKCFVLTFITNGPFKLLTVETIHL